MNNQRKLGIKLRKYDRICPITGYREDSIKVGSPVIVQTDRGVEFGEIVSLAQGYTRALARDVRLKKVLRYATAEDLAKEKEIQEKEARFFPEASQKAKEYDPGLRLINLEILFDFSHAVVYYRLKEGRKVPNLRELARELAHIFGCRADLRQVSPRDEARLFGGLGPCGRNLCCSTWLEKPKHVTVRMVKDQGLAMSPTKTAGVCGRLMCCLEYEHEAKPKR